MLGFDRGMRAVNIRDFTVRDYFSSKRPDFTHAILRSVAMALMTVACETLWNALMQTH